MTDLTTDELRSACEVAELHVYRDMVFVDGWGGLHLAHPFVKPAVASLLVEKVRAMGEDAMRRFNDALQYATGGPAFVEIAAIIRAALAVLREVVE